MTRREKALEELKKQIRAQKSRLDPRLLKMAEKAAALRHEGKEGRDMVAYDRKSAARAVEIFLSRHGDRANFEQRLLALLKDGQDG